MGREIIYVVLFTFFIQGCGTIIHGSQQNLAVGTTPPGALATIGSQQCVTPCTLDIPRNARYIQFEKEQTKKYFPLVSISVEIVSGMFCFLPDLLLTLFRVVFTKYRRFIYGWTMMLICRTNRQRRNIIY